MVRVLTSDAQYFDIDVDVANMSGTIRHLLDVIGVQSDGFMPLPNVRAAVFARVVEFCTSRHLPPEYNCDDLIDLVVAANYLDVGHLMDAACQRLVDTCITGKTVQEMRAVFGATELAQDDPDEVVHDGWLFD
jgi:hypothetical protein